MKHLFTSHCGFTLILAMAFWGGVEFPLKAETKEITTQYLTNNDFENGTTDWTVSNLQTQSNTSFTRKHSNTYLEIWTGMGSKIGDASVSRTIKALPRGKYRLTARGLHIQQSAVNSTTNKGTAQTGAVLFAGSYEKPITANAAYTLNFAVINETEDILIGAKATNATGNWFCIDYFQLYSLGEIDNDALAERLQLYIGQLEAYLEDGVQNSVRTDVLPVLETAKEVVQADPLDESALQASITEMRTAVDKAAASNALYVDFRADIAYARQVLEWWRDVPYKKDWSKLETAISTMEKQVTNYSQTESRINTNRDYLKGRIKLVDKQIYESNSAVGTGTALNNEDNQWCYQRSMQSKHWILFWEKGYGPNVPAAVPGILSTADKIFEFYADSLKFITINQGTSKTDSYKMYIRLRYTTDWEASGSGIDNTIGLLTLSNGAHTSRNGQTVAHEIGHCFQYQVHCDNGNWNGWLYKWGKSTLNVFWEMCAQWQAYKFYPDMQFDNEWLSKALNGLHRHPLSVDLRYNNYFIQDYMCDRNGMDVIARLWNNSHNPQDPLEAYMSFTMSGPGSKRLVQLGDEMWEYGARMTTFDMDHLRARGASTINKRSQTGLTLDADKYWWPTAANCIENWGNNAIRLNAPSTAKTVYVDFQGKAGAEGYVNYKTESAGWRVGFVALQKDGTRVYSDITPATYDDSDHIVAFDCPANCSYLWFVVSGAPTEYWTRDWLSWDEEGQTEQWPYRVHFYQTNVFNNSNDNGYPVGISDTYDDTPTSTANNVYSITGRLIRQGSTSLQGLPRGIYIVNGEKVSVR